MKLVLTVINELSKVPMGSKGEGKSEGKCIKSASKSSLVTAAIILYFQIYPKCCINFFRTTELCIDIRHKNLYAYKKF